MIAHSEKMEFLHGACVEFACALHDKYGYPVEHIRRPNGALIHAYCIANKRDLSVFIDIRGIQKNWIDFIEPYYREINEVYSASGVDPNDYHLLNKYFEDDPHRVFRNDEILYKKAELIISDNDDIYNLTKLI